MAWKGRDGTMKVVRQIVYESDNQKAIDRCLSRSLPDGVKDEVNGIGGGQSLTITVRTILDERVKVEYPDPVNQDASQPLCPCNVCKKVRAIRADVAANGVDGIADQLTNFTTEELTRTEPAEYHPTTQDESESKPEPEPEPTEGCN